MPAAVIRPIQARDTIDLRHRVMWPDRPREKVILPEDANALHFGAFVDDRLVGVGSFFPSGTTVRLRKLAVAKSSQGQGIARTLVTHAVSDLQDRGHKELWCDARVSALGFYLRLGFSVEGEVFDKDGVQYRVARIALGVTG